MIKVTFQKYSSVEVKPMIVLTLLNHYKICAAKALKTGSFEISSEETAYEIAQKLRACGLYVEVLS